MKKYSSKCPTPAPCQHSPTGRFKILIGSSYATLITIKAFTTPDAKGKKKQLKIEAVHNQVSVLQHFLIQTMRPAWPKRSFCCFKRYFAFLTYFAKARFNGRHYIKRWARCFCFRWSKPGSRYRTSWQSRTLPTPPRTRHYTALKLRPAAKERQNENVLNLIKFLVILTVRHGHSCLGYFIVAAIDD